MKKILILLLAAIGAVTGIKAQGFVGSWELFSSSPAPTKVIETPEYVYTLSGNSLSAIDKQTGEIQSLNALNRLNGNKVSKIWYDAKKKCLLVAHTDYNIDLVYDDGRTINVPDLRDAAITGNKTINDADFSGNKAYLALGCGFIVVDIDHGAIVKSHIYNVPIYYIAVTKNHVVIAVTEGSSKLKYAPLTASLNNFSDFKDVVDANGAQLGSMPTSMFGIYDNAIVFVNKYNVLKFDFSGAVPARSFLRTSSASIYDENRATPTSKGYAFAGTDNTVFYANNDGTTSTLGPNTALNGQLAANWNADQKNLWLADANGTGLYNIDSASYTRSKSRPQGPSGTNTGRIIPLSDGRILLSTLEMHQYQLLYSLAYGKKTYADIFNPSTRTFTPINQDYLGSSLRSMIIIPNDENKILVSIRGVGFRIIDLANDSYIEAKSSDVQNLNDTPTGAAVDANGNLWLVVIRYKPTELIQLVKAPKGSWETSFDGSKWSVLDMSELKSTHTTRLFLDEAKGNVIVTGGALAVVKMPENSQPLSSSTKYSVIDVSRDEDDASTGDPWIFYQPSVDKNGWIWVPHNQGVFVIKDSDRMFEAGYHAMRPKVPRNDGTDLADYLLQQVQCTKVAVDENNQKWIGTVGSGLYRVSPNGDMILEHILSASSQMPSDNIFEVVPSKTSNDVYVGTSEGFSIYHSESSPAADNYENVYTYPNPVTPDYAGYITVVGLMEDSLVKIADASGTIVHEGRSNGGMFVWDGCDTTGRRVRSGVYFVFASQTAEEQSNAAVTKIIVVN